MHTHGVYGSLRYSKNKQFLNIWHGMPIKRLSASARVGLNQTHVAIATSPLHAHNLAEAWKLSASQIVTTGLPRNDVLTLPRSSRLSGQFMSPERTILWLPTYRTSIMGQEVHDGVERGNIYQMPGATHERINTYFASLGVQCLVKSHPMAPEPMPARYSHLTVLTERQLREQDVTLYELLAQADALITDVSSVWVDFLLTKRPIVFAMSDEAQYAASRGFYLQPFETSLPGPLCADLPSLFSALSRLLAEQLDDWTEARQQALKVHHTHLDSLSSQRVASLAVTMLQKRAVQYDHRAQLRCQR